MKDLGKPEYRASWEPTELQVHEYRIELAEANIETVYGGVNEVESELLALQEEFISFKNDAEQEIAESLEYARVVEDDLRELRSHYFELLKRVDELEDKMAVA